MKKILLITVLLNITTAFALSPITKKIPGCDDSGDCDGPAKRYTISCEYLIADINKDISTYHITTKAYATATNYKDAHHQACSKAHVICMQNRNDYEMCLPIIH